jgi:hypothetical protein
VHAAQAYLQFFFPLIGQNVSRVILNDSYWLKQFNWNKLVPRFPRRVSNLFHSPETFFRTRGHV